MHPPGARAGSPRSPAPTTQNQFNSTSASQETLTTMAEDTGGRAFFDSNSFGAGVRQGRQRYVGVLRARLLQLQPGARRPLPPDQTADEAHRPEARVSLWILCAAATSHTPRRTIASSSSADQLISDLSSTDLSAYISASYFRVGDNRYFVPLSVVVPGYQIPITRTTPKDKATRRRHRSRARRPASAPSAAFVTRCGSQPMPRTI